MPLLLNAVDSKPQYPPTLILTGATASLKASANFAAFATGKFAMRAIGQSLAREFGPQGKWTFVLKFSFIWMVSTVLDADP